MVELDLSKIFSPPPKEEPPEEIAVPTMYERRQAELQKQMQQRNQYEANEAMIRRHMDFIVKELESYGEEAKIIAQALECIRKLTKNEGYCKRANRAFRMRYGKIEDRPIPEKLEDVRALILVLQGLEADIVNEMSRRNNEQTILQR